MTDQNETKITEGERLIQLETRRQETVLKIRDQFAKTEFPDPVMENIFYGKFDKNLIKGKKLIRDKNSTVEYDIVSDKYQLIQHEEVVQTLLDACPAEFGKPELTIELFKAGAISNIKALFPEMGDFKVNGSNIQPRVNLRNSYDRSTHLMYSWGAEELVCTNGLTAFVEKERGKFKHLTGSISKMELEGNIKTSLTQFSEQLGVWDQWAEKVLGIDTIKEVIASLPFSENEQESLLTLPLMNHGGKTIVELGKEATLWSVNSAATQYAKHEVKSETRSADLEIGIASEIVKFSK